MMIVTVVVVVVVIVVAIATHSELELQRLVDRLAESCHLFGLAISVKKTEVIGQGITSSSEINCGGESLKTGAKFIILGSTIVSTLSLDEKLTSRMGQATASFKNLSKEHRK